jgi:hypothetical protein
MPKGRSPRVSIFMVSSQETAEFVSVEIVWLGQSPGHRRLRFSFQINDVKDPTGFRRPHCLAPVGGGGGYLVAGLFRVNRSFQTFPRHPGSSGIRRKNHTGPPRGNPHTVGSDSIEARENSQFEEEIKVFLNTLGLLQLGARPEREAAIYWAPLPVSIAHFISLSS